MAEESKKDSALQKSEATHARSMSPFEEMDRWMD